MVKLDIFSDPICPWCYIGKAQLDRAIAARDAPVFEIAWHPFQLNPDMPRDGMDRRSYLEAKFGGSANADRACDRIAEAAAAEDLEIDFDAIERTPNTLDAHRLILWAGIEGRQGPIVDALFAAYFRNGRDIGRTDVLADLADSVGLDASVILRLLASDADLEQIRTRDQVGREMGVTGVPTFIVAGAHAVAGAQPTALWEKVMEEIVSRQLADP